MRVVVLTVFLLLAVAAPASALTLTSCPTQKGFACGTLAVPLDRAAPAGGTVHLRFAVQSGRDAARRPLLVALTGGPGQPGVAYASGFAYSLKPALSRYRLAVLDQRGTGRSGALDCPALQRLDALTSVLPDQVGACAQLIGPRRAFYATRDSVDDLEALRVALGAPSMALMGVSYGTFVAQQYARVHPATTRALILDSVVGGAGVDAFLLDSYRATPRVLREQCARQRCAGITTDPVADVGQLAAAVEAGGMSGRVYDSAGRTRTATYGGADQIVNLLVAGDLNPFLQASLPGAIASALDGDPSLLLRLRRVGAGGATKLSDLSYALNVTTGCEDTALPYELTSPPAVRGAATQAALSGLDPASFAPFDAATVLRTSYAEDCMSWPQEASRAPSADPLPDVPALLLTGRLDLRTPMENTVALAQELPHAAVVRVPGTGHDELDSDITGCTAVALSRFVRGRTVGSPCSGTTNQVTVLPRPPLVLAEFRRAPGVPGDRGRALFAALDTVSDAQVTVLQYLYADLSLRGGGLRGGSFSASGATMSLRRYAYLPGLRLTGRVHLEGGTPSGRLRVDAAKGLSGTLVLHADGSVTGRLGGRDVRYAAGGAGGRSLRAAAARRVGGAPRLAVAAGPLLRRAAALLRGHAPRPH